MKKLARHFLLLSTLFLALMLTGCRETRREYILYNTDTKEEINLYKSNKINDAPVEKTVDARSTCYLYDRNVGNGVAMIGLPSESKVRNEEDTYFVDQNYIFRKIVKYKVRWSGSEKIYKIHLYEALPGDGSLKVERLQDSHLHYKSSPQWTTVAMVILFLMFSILWAFINAKNNICRILCFLAGIGFLCTLFFNYFILGDGFVQILYWDWLDATWFAWANIGFFIVNFILLLLCIVAIAAFMPMFGLVFHDIEKDSTLFFCNLGMAVIAYIGGGIAAYFCDEGIFIAIMVITYLISIFMMIWGLCKGKKGSIIYILFPIFYFITTEAIVNLMGSFLYMFFIMVIAAVISFFSSMSPMSLRGRNSGSITINGEEVEEIGPEGGFSQAYRSKSTGKKYGSNDGGNTAEEI